MKVAIPFGGGGGRGCQRKSKPWGKISTSFKLSTTKDSRKLMMYNAVFLFRDPRCFNSRSTAVQLTQSIHKGWSQ